MEPLPFLVVRIKVMFPDYRKKTLGSIHFKLPPAFLLLETKKGDMLEKDSRNRLFHIINQIK